MDFFYNAYHAYGHGNQVSFTASPFTFNSFDLLKGKLELSNPLPLKISQGTRFYDIAYFYDDPRNFCISEKLRDRMLEVELTGWKTYDVTIENCDRKYYGMSVTSVAGPIIDPDFRGFVIGLEFDQSTWDGSDIFRLENYAGVLFTHKFVNIVNALKIKNVNLVNIKDLEHYSLGRK